MTCSGRHRDVGPFKCMLSKPQKREDWIWIRIDTFRSIWFWAVSVATEYTVFRSRGDLRNHYCCLRIIWINITIITIYKKELSWKTLKLFVHFVYGKGLGSSSLQHYQHLQSVRSLSLWRTPMRRRSIEVGDLCFKFQRSLVSKKHSVLSLC